MEQILRASSRQFVEGMCATLEWHPTTWSWSLRATFRHDRLWLPRRLQNHGANNQRPVDLA